MTNNEQPDTQQEQVYHHDAGNLPSPDHHTNEVIDQDKVSQYWKANIRLLVCLLAVWFTVSFGFGILLLEPLNHINFFGFKFGFWWAQQGSIYVFVALIFVYVVLIKRIERRHGVDDDE